MSVLLAAGLAALSTWLWLTPWNPSERVARLRMRPLDHDPQSPYLPKRPNPSEPPVFGRVPTGRMGIHSTPWAGVRAGHQNDGRVPLGHARSLPDGLNPPVRLKSGLRPSRGGGKIGEPLFAALQSRPVSRSRSYANGSGSSVNEGQSRHAPGEAISLLLAALGGFLLIGGLPGLAGGIGIGIAVVVARRRREPGEVRRRQARLIAELPFALDLMVACLRAGQPVSGAVQAAADAMGGPLGERLAWVNGQLRLGARPEVAWSALEADRPLAALARGMTRAALSGAPVADVLSRLADDARREAHAASIAAARRVGVQAVAPLGLCFLPAFVFLGIIPVVAGLAGQVFGG